MEKIKDLFVASKINDHSTFTSNQFEGNIYHDIKVSKKKYLVYSTIDENGVIRYYEYESKRRITDEAITHSYTSQASEDSINYYNFQDILNYKSNRQKMRKRFEENEEKFGYFIPINDYIQMNIPFYKPNITNLIKAHAIVRFLNTGSFGNILLNSDTNTAHKQLEDIKCYKKEPIVQEEIEKVNREETEEEVRDIKLKTKGTYQKAA